MGKIKYIKNEKFGRWTVVEFSGVVNSNAMWLCVCECGTERVVKGSALREGRTFSCGCYNKEMVKKSNIIDISGKRYGNLTVVEYFGVENKITKWKCKCDCGNEKIINGSDLKRGHTKSCGCIPSGISVLDISGNRYGILLVLNNYKIENGQTYWECLCDCGGRKFANSQGLKCGDISSCGCLSESSIAYDLKKYFLEHYNSISEYSILKNKRTGKYLPYDIYIPERNIFIEINGIQHYKFVKYFHRTKENFNYSKEKDKMKRKFAKKNGTYIEIDLRKIKTLNEAILYIESFL